jgi:hypothetical protein
VGRLAQLLIKRFIRPLLPRIASTNDPYRVGTLLALG